MTLMAGYFTQQMPFKDVYIHGLVRDENNKKMSKSAGNGIDPLLLIEKYGTDALRYTLIKEVAGAGQDIRLEYDRQTDESISVQASRNFANKLWNASRFVLMNLAGETPESLGQIRVEQRETLDLSDRWILSRYYYTVQQTRSQIETYGLGEAAKGLYEFIWGDFCDWYIELAKSRLWAGGDQKRSVQPILATVLEGILKLLHPFMPHITEEIWHTLTQRSETEFLALQAYPEVVSDWLDPDLEQTFELLTSTIRIIRNLRAEAQVKPALKVYTILHSENAQEREILTIGSRYIQDLAKVEEVAIVSNSEEIPQQSLVGVTGTVQIALPLAGVVV